MGWMSCASRVCNLAIVLGAKNGSISERVSHASGDALDLWIKLTKPTNSKDCSEGIHRSRPLPFPCLRPIKFMNPSPQPSVWHYKSLWCQPWSIVLTAIVLISTSWFLFHAVWITLLVVIPVLTWMIFFVGIYPRLYLQSLSSDLPEDEITPMNSSPEQ
jgi:hypothetical protein